MPVTILYLLKLSIGLSVVWLFYQLLLRRLTFYSLNRWYLLLCSALCFFIPLIDVAPMVERAGEVQPPLVVRVIPVITPDVVTAPVIVSEHSGAPDVWSLLLSVIVLGSLILATRLVISWMALSGIRRRSKPLWHEGVRVYQVDAAIVPFSFWNAFFINKGRHTEGELEEILAHEGVHIRQRHTVDVVLAELLCVVCWFNPFAWLIRRSIRQNLEFIADSRMLEQGYDRKGYQYHLLKVTGQSPYRLANNFNFSSLKKRIVMMNRIQSARVHLIKFLFILPLIGVLLVAFRGRVGQMLHPNGAVTVNVAGIITDDQDLRPLAGVTVNDKNSGLSAVTDSKGFYKLRIPVKAGAANLDLQIYKEGYSGGRYGTIMHCPGQSRGLIRLETMHVKNDPRPGMDLTSPISEEPPADPGYADVLAAFENASKDARDEMTEEKKMQFQTGGMPHPPSIVGIGVRNGKLHISSGTGKDEGTPPILCVIDGVPGNFDPDVLTPGSVYSLDMLSTEKSQALYPEKCNKCVVIEFTTRKNKEQRDVAKWGPYYSKGSLVSDKDKVLIYYH